MKESKGFLFAAEVEVSVDIGTALIVIQLFCRSQEWLTSFSSFIHREVSALFSPATPPFTRQGQSQHPLGMATKPKPSLGPRMADTHANKNECVNLSEQASLAVPTSLIQELLL